MTIIIPKRDKTLMVTLKYPANMNIPKNAIGKPNATQKAKRVFKNNDKNIRTNSIPIMAFSVKSSVLCTKVVDKSLTTFNSTLLYF